ncbi:tetratricopeptide repeat protein [Azoarcus sp. KH32C]|uniref:O-linked N-acetylglucosamine transferase, SPINDLY family protein n=1 Tax=Azoarcus sp. KH32C TaxID=748247 RepID=UPI00023861E2|nr:tetratricopeptide repeat protein [Azoarcus sp. KH32C]BAL26796.1 hypothetical protein AZKH_4523 [Azoarcus sp. KH32C]
MSKKIEKLLQQAQAAFNAGNREQAQRSYERILEKDPRHLDARYFLGTMLAEQARYAQAQQHLEMAARIAPDSPYIHNNLGNVYLLSGQDAAAEQAFRKALRIAPQMSEAQTNLGNLLVKRGALEEAIELAGRAVATRPNEVATQVMLANALKDQGRIREAIPHYRRAVQLSPGNATAQSNLLMALNYLPEISTADIRRAHEEWGARFPAAGARPAVVRSGRLRVGYLSPDLGRHPVGCLIEPVLAAHDHERFEIFVYSDTACPDSMTERLRGHANTWREIGGFGNDHAASVIASDGLDVLVELAGHGAGNRLAMLGRRLAPVQVSYLGYPATTGLASMDYVITDSALDPSEADDACYTEKLWRLDRPCFGFRPDAEFPVVAALPAAESGALTFGSFNALGKVNDAVIDLWAEVLRALPASRLLMQARALSDPGSRSCVAARFGERGIASERVEMHGFMPLAEHLALFHRTDVCLDTFPWNGHMTTLDSLWMGVPVLTLKGDRRAARMGTAIMSAIGLEGFVAESREDFVAKAVGLAGDLSGLRELRASLHERLERSALADGAGLARALEGAFRAMHEATLRRQDA